MVSFPEPVMNVEKMRGYFWGGIMLSESFDISEFISKVEGQSDQEIIYMADLEATAAERHLYKHKRDENFENAKNYATLLKDVVLYLRYGIRTHSVRQLGPLSLNNTGRAC
jgi:hypothetical protein